MTLTWTKLECTVLSRVIFSFSYAGIAQYTRTHTHIYIHSMTCWIPPIWTSTRSPSRSFEKLFACGPIFHCISWGKNHGFLGIFPPIQWILQRSIWKSLVRRPPKGLWKSLGRWISYCWTPMRWWKWWVANFYKKHLNAPPEKRGVFHMKYSP